MGILVLPFLRYFEFSGRSRAAEFWAFLLFNLFVVAAMILNDMQVGPYSSPYKTAWLLPFYALFIFIPMLALTIRRLHDMDASGWLLLLMFVPVINIGFFLVLIFKSGTKGSNAYGSMPKRRSKKRK